MKFFPAIDLRDGKVVRLLRGDFDAQTVYDDDPVRIARMFEHAGAPWIHVVDLDAARTGKEHNRVLIAAIAEAVDIPVQSGGGVRDRISAESLLDTGVSRIVIGTAATEDPSLVEWIAGKYPGRVAVGLDSRSGIIATRGWAQGSNLTTLDLVERFSRVGVAAFVVTDIARDGTLDGPDVEGLSSVLGATDVDVIASGGVGSLDDLRRLRSIHIGDAKRLAGVIVGKAIYENKFSVAAAAEVCLGDEVTESMQTRRIANEVDG